MSTTTMSPSCAASTSRHKQSQSQSEYYIHPRLSIRISVAGPLSGVRSRHERNSLSKAPGSRVFGQGPLPFLVRCVCCPLRAGGPGGRCSDSGLRASVALPDIWGAVRPGPAHLAVRLGLRSWRCRLCYRLGRARRTGAAVCARRPGPRGVRGTAGGPQPRVTVPAPVGTVPATDQRSALVLLAVVLLPLAAAVRPLGAGVACARTGA